MFNACPVCGKLKNEEKYLCDFHWFRTPDQLRVNYANAKKQGDVFLKEVAKSDMIEFWQEQLANETDQ